MLQYQARLSLIGGNDLTHVRNKHMIESIGIDVSKGKLDLGLINTDQTTESLRFGNDHKGIPSLVKVLRSYQDIEDIPIVIEATGGYHYGITFFLIEKGFKKVFVINPIITKNTYHHRLEKSKPTKKTLYFLPKSDSLKTFTPMLKARMRSYLNEKCVFITSSKNNFSK